MSRIYLLVILYFLFVVSTYSQPVIEWQRTFGGSKDDIARSICATSDGGFIVAGTTFSNDGDITGFKGQKDIVVIKYDKSGNLLWHHTLGGGSFDEAGSVCETIDGCFVVAGTTFSQYYDVEGNHGESDIWIIKFDRYGNIAWKKTYGGSKNDLYPVVTNTQSGGFTVVGLVASKDGDVIGEPKSQDAWVFVADSSGNILRQWMIGGSGTDFIHSIDPTSDGGYIMAGYSNSNDGDVGMNIGLNDYWVVKTDSIGTILWSNTYGGKEIEEANSVKSTPDGGCIVTGYTRSKNGHVIGHNGTSDMWVIKLDSTGEVEWQKPLAGKKEEIGYSILLTPDGGYLSAGLTMTDTGDGSVNDSYYDAWLVKLDSEGTVLWDKAYGGFRADTAFSICFTEDGGLALAGSSKSIDGDFSANHGLSDIWIAKLSAPVDVREQSSTKDYIISPNPAGDYIDINIGEVILSETKDLKIYNSLGECVFTLTPALSKREKELRIYVSQLAAGVYFVKAGDRVEKFTKI